MRGDSNERLNILSEAEKTALYGIPGFDDFQRVEFCIDRGGTFPCFAAQGHLETSLLVRRKFSEIFKKYPPPNHTAKSQEVLRQNGFETTF